MKQRRIPAAFMRGGTSNAIVFKHEDLPDRALWDDIFLAAMGTPDPNGRQLNGMGGGISSLSKVCIVGAPSRPDADIDYTFAQIGVQKATVGYGANCGNMSAAMGPFAVDEGIVKVDGDDVMVRIHNTNTKKIIHAHFAMDEGYAAVDGDYELRGVAGTGSPVRLEFRDPGGAGTGKLLPSGQVLDLLDVPGLGRIEVSMVDAGNPVIAGHRDTSCRFLADLAAGDEILLDRPDGRRFRYRVVEARVVDALDPWAFGEERTPSLTLATCWPFDAVVPGGPMLLHASRLIIPREGKPPIDVAAPLPDYFEDWKDAV